MKFNEQFKKLDDLGFVGRGKSKHRPRNDQILYGGKYPFVQTGDVRKAEFYLTDYYQTYNEKGLAQSKLWDKGTLCITIAANIAETAVLGIKACFPDSIIGFIPDKEKADVRFVKYCLETYKLQMQAISQGATQDNLSLEKLRSLNFQIPSKEKQRRIADFLYAYDKLIQNNTQRIAILEQMAEQLYKEWFVRMRFPEYEQTKFIKGIPEGWLIAKASELYKINIGKTPPRSQSKWFTKDGNSMKWVSIRDMNESSIYLYQTSEKITHEGISRHNMRIAEKNSVLLSFKLTVGKVAICSEDLLTNEAIAHFNTKIGDIPKEFTYFYLKNFQYGELGNTSSIGNAINSKIVKSMPILLPNQSILKQFSKNVRPIFNSINNLNIQNQNLRKTRDLFLPRLISGKLQIQTDKLPAVEVQEKVTPFHQKQILAYIIKKQEEKAVPTGEMVLAKNTYLIDKLYGIHTGFNWQNWHYGTYDGKIRSLINGRDGFFGRKAVGNTGYKVLVLGKNKDRILDAKYRNAKIDSLENAMDELLSIYDKFPKYRRTHIIELLNTTCKSIADTQSMNLSIIRQAFRDWETPKAQHPTKAHKFNQDETKWCLDFIRKKDWDKKLLTA